MKIAIAIILLLVLLYYSYKAPRLTSIIAWSCIATIFSSAALILWLPGQFSENAIGMALCVPLIWVALQFWCYWDQSKWRVLFGHIGLSVVCGVIVVLTKPIV